MSYKKTINLSFQYPVLKSHSYFNMAYMNYYGNGTSQNTTRFYEYMGHSLAHEPHLHTPVALLKAYAWFENLSYDDMFELSFSYAISILQNNPIMLTAIGFFIIFYVSFFISLKLQ